MRSITQNSTTLVAAPFLLAGIFLFLSLPPHTAAQPKPLPTWNLVNSAEPQPIAPGVAYIKKSIAVSDSDSAFNRNKTLHLITFNNRVATLKVIDQGDDPRDPPYDDLADAMQQNFCVAGCNGGFFTEDFAPGGLVITSGQAIGSFTTHSLYAGTILVSSDGALALLWNDETKITPDIAHLIQAGPRLVLEGKPKTVFGWEPHRNRTFILTDGEENWAIGLCTKISLSDLAVVLANPKIISEVNVQRALNLDGGTSSSLYFSRGAGKRPFEFNGFKPVVRNYLGITKR
ncbi:MAG: phosphodiester glycosidase family protein [Verrucomicrobiota bacterium]